MERFLCNELHPRQQDLLWFQQDGATAHTAEISMKVFRIIFPGILISNFVDITCPTSSPDHEIPDYFLWGYAKSKVYETHPANIVDLKQQILKCIKGNPKKMLHVMIAFPSPLQ